MEKQLVETLIDDCAAPLGLNSVLNELSRWCSEEAEMASINHDPDAARDWKSRAAILDRAIHSLTKANL